MDKTFICNRCGLCCRNIHLSKELANFHNGNGICFYLDQETDLCTIYENRPTICNVEKSYEKYAAYYSEEEYLALNYKGCELLQKQNSSAKCIK